MSVNKVILIGRLGQKPEIRNTPGGASVVNFSVATNESWMDKNNQKQERTEWHRVVVWGKLAQLCFDYLDKGRQVYLEGRLQTRQWQDKDGATKYTTEVIANTVQFLGERGASAGGASAGGGNYGAARTQHSNSNANSYSFDEQAQIGLAGNSPRLEEPSFSEEDIPF